MAAPYANHRFQPPAAALRASGALALGGLLVGLLSAVSAPAATSATAGAAATSSVTVRAVPVDRRQGTLTGRPDNMPTTTVPARKLKSAKVTQNLLTKRVQATVVLRRKPTTGSNAWLHVAFGHIDEKRRCEVDESYATRTAGSLASGFSRSGATISLNRADSQAGWQDWECAVAAVGSDATNPEAGTYDALVGSLRNVKAKPRLKIASVTMLRRPTAKGIGLVRGVWTTLEVKVKNSGRVTANKVRVAGAGKGVKVRPSTIKVWAGGETKTRVRVRLVGKKRTAVRLVARAGTVKTVRRIAVRPVKAPKPPSVGRYVGLKGKLKFRIKGRKIVGFRIQSYTSCGGYPDFPTYSWNYYSFPGVKVPRNGIVQARQKRRLFTVELNMRVVRGKVTQGYFGYYGPNRCWATDSFTARRAGK